MPVTVKEDLEGSDLIFTGKGEYQILDTTVSLLNVRKKVLFSTTICDRTTDEILKEEKLLMAALVKKPKSK